MFNQLANVLCLQLYSVSFNNITNTYMYVSNTLKNLFKNKTIKSTPSHDTLDISDVF